MSVIRAADTLIVFRILRLLTMKWEEQKAYKLGIIDKDGKPLKKRKDLKTPEEKNAYTMLHRMVFKLKRLLNVVPKGARTLASYGAALALIKEMQEYYSLTDNDIDYLVEHIENPMLLEAHHGRIGFYDKDEDPTDEHSKKKKKKKIEETAAMSASSMNVAGLDKNPPVHNKKKKFAGSTVFDVDSNTFCKTFDCKKKRKRWKNYLSMEDLDLAEQIREYANKNPMEGIVLRDQTTGAMRYIRHPRKK